MNLEQLQEELESRRARIAKLPKFAIIGDEDPTHLPKNFIEDLQLFYFEGGLEHPENQMPFAGRMLSIIDTLISGLEQVKRPT